MIEIWVDITKDCTEKNACIFHGSVDVSTAQWYHNGIYRVRKVSAGAVGSFDVWPEVAFVVEKRVEVPIP